MWLTIYKTKSISFHKFVYYFFNPLRFGDTYMGHSMVLGATFVNVTVCPTIVNVTF